jgi:hypothetical protein
VKNEKFEDILNSCFDQLLKGGTVGECLAKYPDQAKELEPLLRTFAAAKMAAQVNPRAEFKAQAKYQFQVALAEMAEKKRQSVSRGWHWRWRSAWSIAIIAALMVVAAGGGTVAAAGSSMPDSALYPVKIAAENVQLALTPSGLGKAELNAKLADKRVEEIAYMAEKGNTPEVQILAQRLNGNMQNIVHLAGGDGTQGRLPSGTASGGENSTAKSSGASDSSQSAMGVATPAPFPAPSAALPPQAPRTTAAPTSTVPAMTTMTSTTTAPMTTATAVAAAPPIPVTQAVPANNSPAANFGANPNVQSSPTSPNISGQETEKIKIARLLVENTFANIQRLTQALDKASPDVRPAIRQAIAQSQVEYDKAVAILQVLENQIP